jgi:hypothetical protein
MEKRQPPAETPPEPTSQFEIALRRIQQQGQVVDPTSAVAPFNSAF